MSSIRRYEHKLSVGRRHEEGVAELSRHLATDKMLRENFTSDGRVEQRRILNESRAATKDMYATQQLQMASAAQQREIVLREQDERLASELARRKTQAVREAKNVQRICEQSEELRELEEKLKAAKAAAAAARIEGQAPFKPTSKPHTTPTPSIVFHTAGPKPMS